MVKQFSRLTALALSFCLSATAATAQKVELWISAFIPKAHPQLPEYIYKTAAGTFVIDAPALSGFGGTCFESDNRAFSLSPDASARVRIRLLLEVSGPNMTVVENQIFPEKHVGASHNVDCKTGKPLSSPKTASSNTIEVGGVVKNSFTRALFLRAAVANPYFPHIDIASLKTSFGLSPDIDFSAYLLYDVRAGTIEVKGTVGYFPAFEGYYSVDGGDTKPLFQVGPYEKSTALSLFDLSLGVNTRNFSSTIDLR